MYQNQSYLSSSKRIGVDNVELRRHDASESLKTNEQDWSSTVPVDSSNANSLRVSSSNPADWSSGQLILCLVAITLLVAVLVWYLENIGERLERLQRRFRNWRKESAWGGSGVGLVEFPIAVSELAMPSSGANYLGDYGDSEASHERTAHPKFDCSETIETVETGDGNQPEAICDELDENRSGIDSLMLEPQSLEVVPLKQETTEQANERKNLELGLDQASRVILEDAETPYQKLADELAASQLAQSQMQTELSNAQQSLESLTAKNARAEQEIETACHELRGQGDFVGQLESKLVSSESLAESLQDKLKLAQSNLESQVQQTLAAESKIEEIETEAFQLMQQLEGQRTGKVSQSRAVDTLTAKLSERTIELEQLRNHFDEIATSADEKAVLLGEFEVRYRTLVEESEQLKLAQTQTQSELVTAKEEISILSSNAEQAEREKDTAYQEMSNKSDIATGLHEENENLKSTLEIVKNQLATAETDAKNASDSTETIQIQLKQEANRYEQSKQELVSELESARHEIAKLHQNAESSKSELDQNAAKHAQKIESLESRLQETEKEKESRLVENEKLNSIVAKAESELASAQAEITDLKSELADNHAAAEHTAAIQKQLEDANAQAVVSLKQIDLLTSEVGELKKQLGLEIDKLDAATNSQAKRDEQWAELNAQSKFLEQRAKQAELQLAETSEMLTKQQASNAELETAAKQDRNELTLQVAKYSELEANAESLENQMVESQREFTETVSLLEREKSNREKVENTVKQQAADLSVLRSRKSNIESEFKSLEMRAKEADRKLEETVKLLEREQAQHAEIKITAKDSDAKLISQLSRCLELETSVKFFERQIQESDEKLEQTTSELDMTKSLQIELEKTTEQQKTQLNQKEINYIELEAKLRETVESNTDKHALKSERLERQGLKLDELQFALQNEEAQRSEVLKKLESSQLRIAELEQQSQASSVNESNYKEMAKKVVKYKTAFQKNNAHLGELAGQKLKMSELANEYLAAAKILKRDLDAQLEITDDLTRRLDNASSDNVNRSDLNYLVQERARAHVMDLKVKFEERLKKKNKIIRKLKNRESIQS